ncbi:MAG: hypothetical protein JO250_09145 [Armatimonadetes bacterium]|nr:hypothetical protein [Armatimonadota bacterium]
MTYLKAPAASPRISVVGGTSGTTATSPIAVPATNVDHLIVHRTPTAAINDFLFSANQSGRQVIVSYSNDETSGGTCTLSAQSGETIVGPSTAAQALPALNPGESITLTNTSTTTWAEVD